LTTGGIDVFAATATDFYHNVGFFERVDILAD
jgi:hypothetical protein